jgi:pimeloyl-ACP methyl ester carboxylesterase
MATTIGVRRIGLMDYFWDRSRVKTFPVESSGTQPWADAARGTHRPACEPQLLGHSSLATTATYMSHIASIEQVASGSVALIGYSMGALVAQEVALARVELLRGLVLLAPLGARTRCGVRYSTPPPRCCARATACRVAWRSCPGRCSCSGRPASMTIAGSRATWTGRSLPQTPAPTAAQGCWGSRKRPRVRRPAQRAPRRQRPNPRHRVRTRCLGLCQAHP